MPQFHYFHAGAERIRPKMPRIRGKRRAETGNHDQRKRTRLFKRNKMMDLNLANC